MRIALVTAHYPPDLTSGGSLVPQRLAQGLARRGHEVHVYAGRVAPGSERLPREQTDEHGVRVRWAGTGAWIGWADPRNSLNPEAEQDVRAWLDEVRPDVVHLHSLQGLGATLVSAAHERCPVVVTMHDFWWFCVRQFLVDPTMRPCSLVVDCGGCPCEVDPAVTTQRIEALRPHLAAADLVLAPSASAAAVLAANGVPAERLEVDENGLPPQPTRRLDLDPEPDRVRLMFAGGTNPMKGLDVLLDAVAALPQDATWSLDLYGVPHAPERLGPRVLAHEAYRPDDLPGVLAAHDVLVLPSVMRETHSILTREALSAGLAVVCTDTLGPEEVVRDAVNGLVVPAADAAALGAALARLVADRALVDRLRAAPAPATRTLQDQVAGLEERYARLVAARSQPSGPAGMPVRRVLFVAGINGAPLRYRVHLPAEALATIGVQADVRHYRDPEVPALAARADAVVLYRVPATVQVADLVAAVRARPEPVPVLADLDDLVLDPGLRGTLPGLAALPAAEEELWWRGVARYRTTVELADLFVGSTQVLCDRVAELTGLPVRRFANGVGRALVARSELALAAPRRAGPTRLGYFSGTTTHDADWASIEPAVVEVMAARPEVELWLGGHVRPTPALDALAGRVRRRPMMPFADLVPVLRDVDVALAPLVPGSVFNEAKSAVKWLEAAMVATPTVASSSQPFREAIEHGVTGMLATDRESWAVALGALLDDPVARARIGARARRAALLGLGPHVQGAAYLRVLQEAVALVSAGRAPYSPTLPPVLDDEPYAATEAWLEPADGSPAHRRQVPVLVRRLAAVRRVLRHRGLRGLVVVLAGRARAALGRTG